MNGMPDPTSEDLEDIDFTCMECGHECETHETIHSGDEKALRGWEVWCYCPACDVETFHPVRLKENEPDKQI